MVASGKQRGRRRTSAAALVVAVLVSLLVVTPTVATPAAGASSGPAADEAPTIHDAALAVPTVTSLIPTKGLAAGGTSVTITGTGFTGATGVRFGATTPATSFTVVSDTMITAVAPPPPVAPAPKTTVNVFVDTTEGSSTSAQPSWFRYIAPPAIASITPTSGSFEGGWRVELTVTDPDGGWLRPAVDGTPVPAFTYNTAVDPRTMSFTMPPRSAGAAHVTVENVGGASAAAPVTYLSTPLPDVSGLSPQGGSVVGGTPVTITGANLTGATTVTFETTPPQSVPATVVSDTQVTAMTPPSAHSGTVRFWVTTPAGTSATWPGYIPFTYLGPPEISAVTPNQGYPSGGTTVTINGKDLDDATAVRFGDVPAASWSYSPGSGTITAVAPPQVAGPVAIRLDSALGPSDTRPSATFTYAAVPTPHIVAVSPPEGPRAGGTAITITGHGFTGATAVRVGGNGSVGGPAASFTVVSDSRIDAVTAPSPNPGVAGVYVDTPRGTNPYVTKGRFGFLEPPVLSSLSPGAGTTAGGQTVTLTGYDLLGADQVLFGDVPATSVTVVSPTTVTAVSPPRAAGPVPVTVHTPSRGWSPARTYTYEAPAVPVVTALSPAGGPVAGGTTVTITGTGLATATGVRFGATNPATSFTVVSDTRIDAIAPPAPGPANPMLTVNVFVDTPAGTSTSAMRSWYRYSSVPPTVTAVSPDQGPATTPTTVTVTGTGFQYVTAVLVGGVASPSFTVASTSSLTAVVPSGPSGPVDVQVVAWGGTSAIGPTARFQRFSTPWVSSLSSTLGPTAGGQVLHVYGQSLGTASSVTIGLVPGTGLVVHSDTHVSVVTPPRAAGLYHVRVTTAGGTSGTTSGTSLYRYAGPATITELAPAHGSTAGGTVVEVLGADLYQVTGVTVGGVPATSWALSSPTRLVVRVPPGVPGDATIAVTTALGTPTATFTYVDLPAPVVRTVSPASGPIAGGTTVTLTGSGFTGATAVLFGGEAPSPSFTVISDTEIVAVTPSRPYPLAVPVQVRAPGGQNANSWQQYTFTS